MYYITVVSCKEKPRVTKADTHNQFECGFTKSNYTIYDLKLRHGGGAGYSGSAAFGLLV